MAPQQQSQHTQQLQQQQQRRRRRGSSMNDYETMDDSGSSGSHKILRGLAGFSETVLSRLCCTGGVLPFEERDVDYNSIQASEESSDDVPRRHRPWTAPSSCFAHPEQDPVVLYSLNAVGAAEVCPDHLQQEQQKERWLDLYHRQQRLHRASQPVPSRHEPLALRPNQHDCQQNYQQNYPIVKPSSRLVPQMIPASFTESSSGDSASCRNKPQRVPSTPRPRFQLASDAAGRHLVGGSNSCKAKPTAATIPTDDSHPPSVRKATNTPAHKHSPTRNITRSISLVSDPPKSFDARPTPNSGSCATTASMGSFDDLVTVETSSDCSTAVTSHQHSVISHASSAAPSQDAQKGDERPLLNRVIATPSPSTTPERPRSRDFERLTKHWKHQERQRLERQQQWLQRRQLPQTPIHPDEEQPVKPVGTIRYVNHAEGLTC